MNIIQKNGKYWKECDIVMLPTKGNSNILQLCHNKKLILVSDKIDTGLDIKQHLYLLSNEQINEGDYYYYEQGAIYKAEYSFEQNNTCRKIIASTDSNLMQIPCHKCNGLGIKSYYNLDNCSFCKGSGFEMNDKPSIPKPSENFIKKYVESNGAIKKVLVEYEEDFSKVPEDSGSLWRAYIDYKLKLNPDNTINILIEDSIEEAAEKFALENRNSGEKYAFVKGAEWQKNQLNN